MKCFENCLLLHSIAENYFAITVVVCDSIISFIDILRFSAALIAGKPIHCVMVTLHFLIVLFYYSMLLIIN